MIQQFHALAMDRTHALAAYPLVSLHDGSMTRTKWLRLVGQHCRRPDGRTGLMAIRDGRGIIHALFPKGMKWVALQTISAPANIVRAFGLLLASFGVVVVWLLRH